MAAQDQLHSMDLTGYRQGVTLTTINIFVCMGLAAVKIVSGILGTSYALVSDGIESLTDIFSSTIVWGGLKIGKRPPDDNHPFGHGRAESLAAVIVSLTLVGVALGIAIQSVREILLPHHTPAPWTLIVLIAVIIIKETMARAMFRTGRMMGSVVLTADAWHSRSDALTSLAALIGISISLLCGAGYEAADDWAALFASGVIFFNGARIFQSAAADIMDAAVPQEFEDSIKDIARRVSGVHGIEKCRIRKSGIYYFVEIHVVVDAEISVREGHLIGHEVKTALMSAGLSVLDVLTHIEPL